MQRISLMLRLVAIALSCGFYADLWAQSKVLEFFPEKFTINDTLRITYDASQGNAALAGYDGDVYIHTGVIVGSPEDPSGWRYVQGNWGMDDPKVKMKRIGEDKYMLKFHIKTFYGMDIDENLLQIVCVFRNVKGDIVGKTALNTDFYYPELVVQKEGAMQYVSGADADFLGDLKKIDYARNGSVLLESTNGYHVRFDAYPKDILRVSYTLPGGTFREESEGVALLPNDIAKIAATESADKITLSWAEGKQVVITRKPMRFTFYHAGKPVLSDADGLFFDKKEKVLGVRFKQSPNEHFYGTGSRSLPLDRHGQRVYTYNTARYAYSMGEKVLNMSIPFVLSSAKYGILFDNPANGYMDFGRDEKDVWEYGTVEPKTLSYYVILGKDQLETVQRYTDLTGHQPLPPRWTMGFMQSRFGYKTEAETREITEKTLAAGYPLEAIFMDLYWFGDKERMGDFAWNSQQFPNPKQMFSDLAAKGVKIIPISESYFVKDTKYWEELDKQGYFAKGEDNKSTFIIKDFWAGSAGLLDVFNEDARRWFWQRYREQTNELNIHGWWCDSGEPENHPKKMTHTLGKTELVHNLYQNYWAKMLYENWRKEYPKQRPVNFSRSGYAGIQRYGVLPWSGDVSRNWDGLNAQPLVMLGAAVSGVSYMHSDAGGFTNGPKNPQLYQRWLQYAAFTPIMRAHGEGVPAEPIFQDDTTQAIVRKAIDLRYRLLPYNYSLAFENHLSGTPLARPMHLMYPDDEKVANTVEQYMWGDALMVLPILKPDVKNTMPYLPAGKWFDLHTDSLYEGSSKRIVPVQRDWLPVLVRGGSFVPMLPAGKTHSSQYTLDTLLIQHYPVATPDRHTSRLYFDDGTTPETYKNKQYHTEIYSSQWSSKGISLNVERTEYITVKTKHYLTLHGIIAPPRGITMGKAKFKLAPSFSGDCRKLEPNTYYWDAKTKQLHLYPANWKETILIAGKAMLAQ